MAKDSDYRRMIQSRRWSILRRRVIGAHPLCERCELDGYVTAAEEVHHRVPVEHGLTLAEKERLMFDELNLEALCRPCHVARHVELGRSGRAAATRIRKARGESLRRLMYGEEGRDACDGSPGDPGG